MNSGNEVTTTPGAAVGAARPLTGLEGLDETDFQRPRIKLLQALSPEVADGLGRPGEFFHTVLAESMIAPIEVAVLLVAKTVILWNPRTMGGGILARSLDGITWDPPQGEFRVIPDKGSKEVIYKLAPTVRASGLDKWGSSDPVNPQSPPAADVMMNFLVQFPGAEAFGPAIVTLHRSGYKVGQQFAGALLMRSNAAYKAGTSPLVCANVYDMTSKEVRNPKGNFFVHAFRMKRPATEEEFDRYAQLHDFLNHRGVREQDIAPVEKDTDSEQMDDSAI